MDTLTWLRPTVGIALAAVAIALAWTARRRHLARRTLTVIVSCGIVLMLAAPTAWSIAGDTYAQNPTFPDARPHTASTAAGAFGAGPLPGIGDGTQLAPAMLAWLRNHRGHARWIVAVSSGMQAEPAIIAGDSIMPMGGFTGTDPAMTPARLTALVRTGELRYVLEGSGGFGGFGASNGISTIVGSVCAAVSPKQWGVTTQSAPAGTLYDCRGKADAIAVARPTAAPRSGRIPNGGPPGNIDLNKIRQCVAEHDVTLPANPAATPNLSDPKLLAALQACGLPIGNGSPPGGSQPGFPPAVNQP